jgi:TrmH family RNA methyltransferase
MITRISKNKLKLIKSLARKKERDRNGLFIVEGEKMVQDYIQYNDNVEFLAALPEWLDMNPDAHVERSKVFEISINELKSASSLDTPNKVLLVAKKPDPEIDYMKIKDELIFMYEHIQDPGNMGTIIRTAAWFGINTIICSPGTVDIFNPKVVQATMGTLWHVNVFYEELDRVLEKFKEKPVYATSMKGENIYHAGLDNTGIVVFGNEAKGLSDHIMGKADVKIHIPSFSANKNVDSLNVAISTGIVASEFSRLRNL